RASPRRVQVAGVSHYSHDTVGFSGAQFASHAAFIALRIVGKWPRRNPTPRELMDEFGMSRATAYRWLGAIGDALWAVATDNAARRVASRAGSTAARRSGGTRPAARRRRRTTGSRARRDGHPRMVRPRPHLRRAVRFLAHPVHRRG